ncbi:hypothetical protein BGZ57DRAFT_960331 [Hyaloscypha finlandica]|nr:hypothetical protein BGZ57DRAFT_960331 [Hyaloscypha finlandica]
MDKFDLDDPVSTLPRTLLADPDFVGRDEIIEQMKESLINSNRVSLVGLGGIGITEIAVEFAHILRCKNSKTNIFWVYGATRSSFDEAYGKIAEELNIPGWQDPLFDPRVEVPKLLKNKEYGPWVMIIDNADDYSVLFPPQEGVLDKKRKRDYLANCLPSGAQSGGKIIITTRNQKVGKDLMGTGEPIEVLELAPSDATKLLRQKIPSEKWVKEPAEMLVKELGYIPLAITQAAAFIKYYKMTSFKFYLGKLNQFHLNVKDVLSDELYDSRREGGTPNAIFQTWQISYEQIRLEDTHAAEKLSMMAVFDNQAIPDVLLREKDEFDMAEIKAIQILLDFSLTKGDSDYQFFYMHPLQELSTQNWLRSEEHRLEKWQNNGLVLLSQRMPKGRDLGTCANLLPHAIAVLFYESNNLTCFAELSIRVCIYEKVIGRYQDYYQYATESYEALFQLYGDEHLETTYAKYMVGLALERLGKCEDSTRVLREVVRQEERLRGDDQRSFLTTALSLGIAYDSVGNYEAASTFAERALQGYRALSDKNGILDCLCLQARLLLREGNYEKSRSLYERILKDAIRMYGENASKTLEIMSAYSIAIRKHVSAESARYSRLALQGWESLRGRDHPDTIMVCCNFASILENEGNLTEAERLLRQALEARQRLLGLQHPDTLITLGQLASLLERLKIFSEAENLIQQILAAREDTIGLEDVSRPVYLNALGHNLYKQGRLEEAEPILRQALEGEREWIEQVGSDITATSISRSSGLVKDGNTGEEDAFSRRREKLLSLDNRQILHNLASCPKGQGKYDEAEKYQTLLLKIQTRLDGTDALHTLKCKENLAHTFHLRGKHQTALQFMQDVLEKLKQHHAENTASISKTEDRHKIMLDQVLRGDEELAFGLHKQGRNQEALPIIHEVVRRVKTSCPGNETLTESCEKLRKIILGHMLLDKRELALDMHERGEVAEAVNFLQDIVESLKRWDPENTTAIREAEQRCEALSRTQSRIPNPLRRSAPSGQNQNRKDKASKKTSIFSFLSPHYKNAREDSSI